MLIFIVLNGPCSYARQHKQEYTRDKFTMALNRVRQNDTNAVDEIELHGDKTLIWLLQALEDHRTMPNGLIVKNRSKDAFEDVAMYQPQTVSDAVRHILTRLTGFNDLVDADTPTPKKRSQAIKAWWNWYTQHKKHLHWNKEGHFYIWKSKNTKQSK